MVKNKKIPLDEFLKKREQILLFAPIEPRRTPLALVFW